MSDQDPVDDGHCFACGQLNEDGLKMRFEQQRDGSVISHVRVSAKFQGWRGIAHGGIVMTLLDEGMAHAAIAQGVRGVTASMTTRFRAPLVLDTDLEVHGRVKWTRRNVLACESDVYDADGNVIASAEGSFISRGST